MFPISNMDKATLLGWSSPPWTSCYHQAVARFISYYRHNLTHPGHRVVKPNSEVLQTDHLSHLLQPTGDIRVEVLAAVVSGSQLCGWAWELPVFPSWLPGSRSSCNIIIFSGLAGAATLEDEEAPPGPLLFSGGVGAPLLTPARHSWESCLSPPSKCPICQALNPCLTPNLPPLPLPSAS